MKPFLKVVTHDLRQRLGSDDFSRVAVIFPNKRARLFFNDYLAEEIDKPFFAPTYLTISELFAQLSALKVGDPIRLVCELYRIFAEETAPQSETLDDFYFWGELLIKDFDDLDKNLVPSKELFQNLSELKEFSTNEFLTPEQKETIAAFFEHYNPDEETELKQRFEALWNVLGIIYLRFQERLKELGEAYEGMIYREAITHLKASLEQTETPLQNTPLGQYDTYVFVGFNVLNKVEKQLFTLLKEANKALFYWDYDTFYLDISQHEAATFMRQNLKEFPYPTTELPKDTFSNLGRAKDITYIAATSEDIQARYLMEWTAQNVTPIARETAIVLCNEALLLPVYHSLSPSVKSVNVTMGFPLSQTLVNGFLEALIDVRLNGYNADTRNAAQATAGRYNLAQVIAVLEHPYMQRITPSAAPLLKDLKEEMRLYPFPAELHKDEVLKLVFTPPLDNNSFVEQLISLLELLGKTYREEIQKDTDLFTQLYVESIYQSYTVMERIKGLSLEVSERTFCLLLQRLLGQLSIPFHGEPAEGLQVMGVLETRNLDFTNLAVLSLNEGMLPKSSQSASFIPFNLRKAFGMTTIEHQNSVYAYYLYRLMQRAEHITLLYNRNSEGMNAREWSRFMLQFLLEYKGAPIQSCYFDAQHLAQQPEEITVEKSETVQQALPKAFSPSALNTYLDCPLKFYFKYVAGLKPTEEITYELDNALFGTVFHEVAEQLYIALKDPKDGLVRKAAIGELLRPSNHFKIEQAVHEAFCKHLFRCKSTETVSYNGQQLIHRQVITTFVEQLLKMDQALGDFKFLGAEYKLKDFPTPPTVNFSLPDGIVQTIRLGGIIDRLDLITLPSGDTRLRVVDYKTGRKSTAFDCVESLFDKANKTRASYIFQAFYYSSVLCKQLRVGAFPELTPAQSPVSPCLLFIHKTFGGDDTDPTIRQSISKGVVNEVTDFADAEYGYEKDFDAALKDLLEEIFNPQLPFTQTTIPGHCQYCDFKGFCKK